MNFAINTADGDLVDTDDWFEEDATAAPEVYCQLMHHYNRWPGDPRAGSNLHEMHELDDGPAGQESLVIETRRALGVLVEAKRIGGVEVVAARDGAGRVRVDTSYRDLASGKVVTSYLDDFGG